MHRTPLLLAALFTACAEERQAPPDADAVQEVAVAVVDRDGQPLPHAVVWALPAGAWRRRTWIPPELFDCWCNPHELLRRLGTRREADDAGIVRVPPHSVLAGEREALAGTTTIADADTSPLRLVLDDWRWTIVVRDGDGAPLAGVPVSCAPEDPLDPDEQFEGIPLGLADAEGRVVVRDPAGVDVGRYMSRLASGPDPAPPGVVRFEIDGMYLAPHTRTLRLQERESGTVTLIAPPMTKVEVRAPEWRGPLSTGLGMTRIGKAMQWDHAACWSEADRHFGLVAAGSPIVAKIDGSSIETMAEVPRLPAGETFVIQLELDAADAVVRLQVRDASGHPASLAVLSVTPNSDQLRTQYVHADREGRVALVLRPDASPGTPLHLKVDASPDPALLGAKADLPLEGLQAGERRDAGVLTLNR